MRVKIEYIANFLGLSIQNDLVFTDIAEIKDIDNFMVFMKDNIKNTRLDYLNPLQKLTELKKMFIEELNKGREIQARTQSQTLAQKVRDVKTVVKNEILEKKKISYDNLKLNGENYFTIFETRTLTSIGTLRYIVSLDDACKLEDELDKVFFGIIKNSNKQFLLAQKSTNDTLSDTSVKSLVNLALKGNK